MMAGLVRSGLLLLLVAGGSRSLTNTDIESLASAGISADVIQAKIATSECAFDTSTEALVQLKKAGVPNSVLAAMVSRDARPAPAAATMPTPEPPRPVQGAAASGYVERAQVFVARGSWAEAVAAYKAALRANQGDATLHNQLGICYQRMGDAKQARLAYEKAISLKRDYAEAYNNLGTLEHTSGRYEPAIRAYGDAIRIRPTGVFYKNLGQAWLARGDVDQALRAWIEALRIDPNALDPEGAGVVTSAVSQARQYYLFAKLVASRGQVEQALHYIEKAHAAGFKDFTGVERDHDFARLVSDPRYAALKKE
jgi:tetratricopeptide (TPR) repeat protein